MFDDNGFKQSTGQENRRNHKMMGKKDTSAGKIKVFLSYKSTLIHCISKQHASVTQPFLHGQLLVPVKNTIKRATEIMTRVRVTGTKHSLVWVIVS